MIAHRWSERFSVTENYERHGKYQARGILFDSLSLDNSFNKTGHFDWQKFISLKSIR